MLFHCSQLSSISITNPDCTTLGLIRTSLMNKKTTWHGLAKTIFIGLKFDMLFLTFICLNHLHCRENRYLLFLTENYAALHILHHYLTDALKTTNGKYVEPFVLFGSSFPKDKEYTQVKHIIKSTVH